MIMLKEARFGSRQNEEEEGGKLVYRFILETQSATNVGGAVLHTVFNGLDHEAPL